MTSLGFPLSVKTLYLSVPQYLCTVLSVYHSPVLGGCDITGVSSICEDPLSECRLSSDGTGFLNCECRQGTVLVQHQNTNKCGEWKDRRVKCAVTVIVKNPLV